MSKLIYMGGGINSHPVKKLYLGVNNQARKVRRAYIGDATSKARLFYTSGYQWKRYNIQLTEKLESTGRRYSTEYHQLNILYGTDITLNTDSKLCTLNTVIGGGTVVLGNNDYEVEFSVSNYMYMKITEPYGNPNGYCDNMFKLINRRTDGLPANILVYMHSYGKYYVYVIGRQGARDAFDMFIVSGQESKGTYIDIVENDNPDAYPVNGSYNGYWYEKIS